ncbi:hypothetical protein M8J77_020877 [Diaphorina citri]|nr:hypothetical protein M8J77_020877 [Diaphorina citri]
MRALEEDIDPPVVEIGGEFLGILPEIILWLGRREYDWVEELILQNPATLNEAKKNMWKHHIENQNDTIKENQINKVPYYSLSRIY